MTNDKMLALIEYVTGQEAERDELVHALAIALLTRKNLFVLGDPGQSKSHVIDLFTKQIKNASVFKCPLSKETDEEMLFGRLYLSSIIPGNVTRSVCERDSVYVELRDRLKQAMDQYRNSRDSIALKEAVSLEEQLSAYKKCLAELYGDHPEYNTEDKIPSADICFLDEFFKAGEGLVNSLLTALNEREYTNEGVTVKLPVISYFASSNEIPNFNNVEECGLKAVYDRFDLKIKTDNVQEKENRFRILHMKQGEVSVPPFDGITLDELKQMQAEVRQVSISDTINEIMDNIVLSLREKNIPVSDRTYFNYSSVLQAEAWLHGRSAVSREDLRVLKNYLWVRPEEIPLVVQVIKTMVENPMGDQINAILDEAYLYRDEFDSAADKNKALLALKERLLESYKKGRNLKATIDDGDDCTASIDGCLNSLESINRAAFAETSFTCISLAEQFELKEVSK